MLGIGTFPLGTEPFAGDPLHDPPVCTITAPTGTLTTGGPLMTVTWTFSQPQGDPQDWHRVLVKNDAGTTTFYDSGWLFGPSLSHVVDVDEITGPLGHVADSTDVTVEVQVRSGAIGYIGTDTEAIALEWGHPHLTITAPLDGEIWDDADSVDVTWTFTDDRAGKTQGWYRVRLLAPATGQELQSTGWVASVAARSAVVPFRTQDGSILDVEVQAKNNEGIRSD